MFSSLKHTRPIPLLDSEGSSDDSSDEYPRSQSKRLSYTSLVNSQPLSTYHRVVLVFVCAVTFAQSLQLHLPLLLTTHLGCEMALSIADRSLLAVSYPLSHFIAPLLSAVLAPYSVRAGLGVMLSLALVLVLTNLFCGSVHSLVLLRCTAGMVFVSESTLTQLWAHVYPLAYHMRCRTFVALCHALGLAVSILLLMTHTEDIRFIMAVTALTFLPAIMLAFWITETPLMVLKNGKYSQIMRSIEKVFSGPKISTLRLQEIDFSDDSATHSWNPVYLFQETRNRRNILIVGALRATQGVLIATMLCTFHSVLHAPSETSCFIDAPENCTLAHSDPVSARDLWDSRLAVAAVISVLGTYLVPCLPIHHTTLLLALAGTLSYSLLAACALHGLGRVALLCLTLSLNSSLHSVISHLASTVTVSIAGECLTGLLFTLSMVLAKLLSDSSKVSALALCAATMTVLMMASWLARLPPTKDKCDELADPDDPLMEELEMELERVEEHADTC